MGHDDGGGMTVGIDPEALNTLITDADTATTNIESFTSTYRSRFSENGVDVSNITRMEQVASWVHDQLPMLRRRRDIGRIALNQSGYSLTSTGAGELPWEKPEDAAAAGKEDAERLLEGLEPGEEIPAEVYELLEKHNSDPDYMEAFFNTADPDIVHAFLADAARDQPMGEYDPAKMVYISNALATASHRIDFTDPEWQAAAAEHHGDPWDLLVPFMKYGNWSEDFLHGAADNLGGFTTAEDQATVLNALARNPVAAAKWYQGKPPEDSAFETNAELVGHIMQGDLPQYNNDETHAAMVNLLEAATNGCALADQDLADKSVATLLENVKSWEGSAELPYQKFFGDLAERHIDDIYDSVTSPSEVYFDQLRGNRDGVEAPADQWAALTEQAMRDPETAAYLSLVFEEKYSSVRDKWEGSVPDETEYGNDFTLAMTRQFSGWFVQRGENVAAALDKDVADYNADVAKAVDLLFAASDPKALVKTLAIDTAKSLVTGFFSKPKPDWNVDDDWATNVADNLYKSAYNSYSKKQLPEGVDEHGNPDPSITKGDLPHVTVDFGDYEVTYTGNPAEYEEEYGGKFTDSAGNPLPVEQLDENGLAAYEAWIQDPAVQQAFFNDFSAQMPNVLGGG